MEGTFVTGTDALSFEGPPWTNGSLGVKVEPITEAIKALAARLQQESEARRALELQVRAADSRAEQAQAAAHTVAVALGDLPADAADASAPRRSVRASLRRSKSGAAAEAAAAAAAAGGGATAGGAGGASAGGAAAAEGAEGAEGAEAAEGEDEEVLGDPSAVRLQLAEQDLAHYKRQQEQRAQAGEELLSMRLEGLKRDLQTRVSAEDLAQREADILHQAKQLANAEARAAASADAEKLRGILTRMNAGLEDRLRLFEGRLNTLTSVPGLDGGLGGLGGLEALGGGGGGLGAESEERLRSLEAKLADLSSQVASLRATGALPGPASGAAAPLGAAPPRAAAGMGIAPGLALALAAPAAPPAGPWPPSAASRRPREPPPRAGRGSAAAAAPARAAEVLGLRALPAHRVPCGPAGRPLAATAPSSPSPWAVPRTSPAHGRQPRPCRLPPEQLPSLAEGRLHARARHWSREDETLEGVRQVGPLRREQESCEGKRKREHQRMALDQRTWQRVLCEALEGVRHRNELDNVRLESMSSRTPDTERSSTAMRSGTVPDTPRHPMPLERQDPLFFVSRRLQVDAGSCGSHELRAHSAGPPMLQAACEVVQRHAARAERIWEVEQEAARQCAEGGQQGQSCPSTAPAQSPGAPPAESRFRALQPMPPSWQPPSARRPIRHAGAPPTSAICGSATETLVAHAAALAGNAGTDVPNGDSAAEEPEAEAAPAEPPQAVGKLAEGRVWAELAMPAHTVEAAEEASVNPFRLFPQGGLRELPADSDWFAACAPEAFRDLLSWSPHEDGQDEAVDAAAAAAAAAPEWSGRVCMAVASPDGEPAALADRFRCQTSELRCFQRSRRRPSMRVVPGAACDMLGAGDDVDAVMQLEELSDGGDELVPEV